VRRADLTTFMCQLSRNSGSLNLLEPQGPLQSCSGKALPLPYVSTNFSLHSHFLFAVPLRVSKTYISHYVISSNVIFTQSPVLALPNTACVLQLVHLAYMFRFIAVYELKHINWIEMAHESSIFWFCESQETFLL
jgi:hypothetical protein